MLLSAEIKSLLCKNVIQGYHHEEGEYISPIFLTLKYHGSFRMILNLKKLNEHMPYIHFKMEIGGNIPDGNFLGRNCLGGNFPGGILMGRTFPVGIFPGGNFPGTDGGTFQRENNFNQISLRYFNLQSYRFFMNLLQEPCIFPQ